jgi:Skp family chaperone for outer membrane proteins
MRNVSALYFAMFVLIAGAVTGPAVAAPAAIVATVDMVRVLKESEVGKDLERKAKAQARSMEKDFEAKQKEFQTEAAKLQEQRVVLGEEAWAKRIQDLQKNGEAAQRSFRDREAGIQQGLLRAEGEIHKTMAPIIEAQMKAVGANIVLNRQAVIMGTAIDITTQVITGLNAKMKTVALTPGSSKPAAAKPAAPAPAKPAQ